MVYGIVKLEKNCIGRRSTMILAMRRQRKRRQWKRRKAKTTEDKTTEEKKSREATATGNGHRGRAQREIARDTSLNQILMHPFPDMNHSHFEIVALEQHENNMKKNEM